MFDFPLARFSFHNYVTTAARNNKKVTFNLVAMDSSNMEVGLEEETVGKQVGDNNSFYFLKKKYPAKPCTHGYKFFQKR